jgi:hypothetical protein
VVGGGTFPVFSVDCGLGTSVVLLTIVGNVDCFTGPSLGSFVVAPLDKTLNGAKPVFPVHSGPRPLTLYPSL